MTLPPPHPDRNTYLALLCLGFTALTTQVLLVRELLHLTDGNELILGLALATWLLLTGAGSLLARGVGAEDTSPAGVPTAALQVALGALPVLQIPALRLLKATLPPGLIPDLGTAFLWSVAVLTPFCLVSGFLLARLAGQLRGPAMSAAVGWAYALDCAGSLVGGLALAFALTEVLAPLSTAALLLGLNATAVALIQYREGHRWRTSWVLLGLCLVLGGLRLGAVGSRTLAALYPGQDLVLARSTRWGQLTATRQGRQLTVYANGVPVSSTAARRPAEEAAHWALAQVEDPSDVLVIAGGLGGVLEEVAEHGPARIEYAELDPASIELLQSLHPGSLASATVRAEDGRRLVERAAVQDAPHWDAILVNVPPPSSLQLNRYYTVEFFAAARRALRPGGVLSLAVTGAENYASGPARATAASVVAALDQVFAHCLVVPGDPLRLVAGNHSLTLDITPRLRQRGVTVDHLRPEYLTARLAEDRQSEARRWVAGDGSAAGSRANTDLRPTALSAHLRYWVERSGSRALWPTLFLLGTLVTGGVLVAGHPRRALAAAVVTSGGAGLGLELILLLAYQVACGLVYHQLALQSAAFLAGGGAGALWAAQTPAGADGRVRRLDAGLAALAWGLIPLLHALPVLQRAGDGLVSGVFALCTAAAGAAVGAQVAAAGHLVEGDARARSGGLFGLDLVGACVGALGVGVYLVPLLGLPATCGLVGGVKALSALGLHLATRRGEAALPAPAATGSGPTPDAPVAPIASAPIPFGRSAAAAVALISFAGIGLNLVAEGARSPLYALSFSPWYHGFLVAVLAAVVADAVGLWGAAGRSGGALDRWRHRLRQAGGLSALQWLTFAGAGLVVFTPLFRCFFAVPWLFCHVCPRPCVFGYLRPYLVPAALLANLEQRHWCRAACPLGALHQCQAGLARRSRRVRRPLTWLAPAALVATALAYFEVRSDAAAATARSEASSGFLPGNWYEALVLDGFEIAPATLVFGAVLLLAGFHWLRPFCDLLCPVGTLSRWVLALERRWMRPRCAEEVPDAD